MSNSDGDTSALRKKITQKTPVEVPLGAIVLGMISLAGMAGSWALWTTIQIQQLKEDLTEVKAMIANHHEGVALK